MGKLIRKKTPEQRKKTRDKLTPARDESQEGGAQDMASAAEDKPAVARPPAPRTPVAPKDDTPRGPQFWVASVQFLREVKVELKKVTWPSRKQAIGTTLVVLVFVMILSIYLGATDLSLSYIVKMLLG
ncbi:MAG: preprotein translocase subunit SecE [Thermodesulfobacteriota bacterium]